MTGNTTAPSLFFDERREEAINFFPWNSETSNLELGTLELP